MALKCGARRRHHTCRCGRKPGHKGRHRCGRSGVFCRVISGPKLGRGPDTISREWRRDARRPAHFHACIETWGHGGWCWCDCGKNLGLKRVRARGLVNGLLSCGPVPNALAR